MRAGDRVFVDTNVLLYAVDPADRLKQAAAGEWLAALWESGAGRLSWQVLNEFYVNAVRKLGPNARGAQARVEALAAWQPIGQSLLLTQRAWHWTAASQTSYWEALIVAAAERAGCRWLLSEDFQCSRKFGTLAVISPFQVRPQEL